MQKTESGLMLYYSDVLPIIENFDDSTIGSIFRAIFTYAQTGEVLELPDAAMGVFFLMRHKVDIDKAKYQETILKKKYAGYTAHCKAIGDIPIPYDDWKPWRQSAEQQGIVADEDID